ncbi:MAG: hypothetical protein HYX92_00145 [Chloroflexi bacterium]|nr:hypothetical protein [Chloroflexota bacterium]
MPNLVQLVNPGGEAKGGYNVAARPLNSLTGKRIGLRTDSAWRSFDFLACRLQELLSKEYPASEVVVFRNTHTTGGRGVGSDASAEFRAFARTIDVAILGLCA